MFSASIISMGLGFWSIALGSIDPDVAPGADPQAIRYPPTVHEDRSAALRRSGSVHDPLVLV
jgi:hypothetical protein